VKYGGITILSRGLITKNVKKYRIIEYPRLDESDSVYLGRGPTKISCTIIIPTWSELVALKSLALSHSENVLYVDQTGIDSHYYRRVVLELGEEERLVHGSAWMVKAVFTALDPRLYSAATNEVVY